MRFARAGFLAALVLAVAMTTAARAAPGPASRPPAHRATFKVVYPEPMHRIEGPRTNLRTLRGQVVVLAFLDDRCATCDQTADLLQSMGPSGAAVLGVATGVSPARALAFATKREGRGRRGVPMAVDPKGALARAFGVSALPTIVILDRRGRVAEVLDSPPTTEALSVLLEPLLAEPVPGGLVPVKTRPHLSAFDHPAGAIGPIPRFLRRNNPCPYVAGSLRLIARSPHGIRLYIARAIDGSILVATSESMLAGGGGSVGCGAARFPDDRRHELARMRKRGIVAALGNESPGRTPSYELVVLDGYTQVLAGGLVFPVTDNGVVVEGVPRQTYVTLSGPAGTRHVRIFG